VSSYYRHSFSVPWFIQITFICRGHRLKSRCQEKNVAKVVVATSNWGFSSFIFLNVDAKRFAFSGLGNVLTLSRNVLRLVCNVFLNHRLQIKVFYTFFAFFLMRVFFSIPVIRVNITSE